MTFELYPIVDCCGAKFPVNEFASMARIDAYNAALRAGYSNDEADDIGFAAYYRVMKKICHPDHPWLKEHVEWAKDNAKLIAGKYQRKIQVS